ncbi:hypothetical protein E6C27_scaffold86G001080 [Cucumis melo var. makuwa]|uniref:Uncharacterized protein n=1 Tax=Cucumis melo var. makuwa TaxID=1194695 RepID=A0A5A7T600_CUCMM|nr:hypothetical protein E6C27_scaffold86G001080 [Cucumis melo var. makuwa]
MLSVVIRSILGYPTFTVGTITGTSEVRPFRSSRTRERSSQCSKADTGYGSNCLMTYPFVEGRSSFSWEYGIGDFSVIAHGTRTLARGPDSPSVDKPCGGTQWSDFRDIGFSPMFALKKPTFSLLLCLPLLAQMLSSTHSFDRSLNLVHLQCKSTRLVSYYALFQGWLLLGKPPGCLCTLTSEQSFRGLSW